MGRLIDASMLKEKLLAAEIKKRGALSGTEVYNVIDNTPTCTAAWIPVSEWLPEDTYSSAEMMNEWFLITTPYGEMKLVQRQKCVPEGFIWFDGYNSYGAVAWKKEELYKID